jgi:hydrophobe/amphiphile efflux-3 (HAE3) family protein
MILEAIGKAVTKAPAMFVIAIIVISLFFGALMSQVSFDAEDEDFNPDTEVALASQRVNEYFGVEVRTVQVITRDSTGSSGDVLTRDALITTLDLEQAIIMPEPGAKDITDTLEGTDMVPSGVQSVADLVALGAMTLQGAEDFHQGMLGLSGALGGIDQALGGVAFNITAMDPSNGEEVGMTLFTTNATLAGLADGLIDIAQSLAMPTNGNGGGSFVPNLTTVRGVLTTMDDQQVKGTIVGMNTFDASPLDQAVEGVVTVRQTLGSSVEVSAEAPIGGPLTALLMDPVFLSGNHTFMGMPVNASQLIEASLAQLYTIQTLLDQLTGFEVQPAVMANIVGGLAGALGFILSLDYDPTSSTPKAQAALMVVQQNGSADSADVLQAQYDLEDIAEKIERDSEGDIEFMIMGGEILFDKINESSLSTLGTLMVLAIVLIIVILALVFRSLSDTALTLVALVFVITWTFGLGTLMGYTFNPLTTAVPILLVGLSVDYGIHLTMRYRLEKRSKSLVESGIATIASVGMALALATVTTVFSFLSNILSSLEIMRQFGMLTAMGIISAFIIMNTFVPASRILLDQRREKKGLRRGTRPESERVPRKPNALVRFVELGAHGAARHGVKIVVVSLVLSALSFLSIAQIDSEFNFTDFLPEDLPETQTITFLFNNFNFSSSSSTILMEGNVATASAFAAMKDTQSNMENDRDVVKANGMLDIRSPLTIIQSYALETSPQYVPEIGDAFRASDTDGDMVPDQDVEELLEMMMGHPFASQELSSVLHQADDGTFDAAVIKVGVHEASDGGEKLTEELNKDIKSLESRGQLDSIIVTDGPVLQYNVVSEMNEGGLQSVLFTIVAAAILLTIVFWVFYRTIAVGILTTIPIILVIGWVFGSMFLLSIPLNVITITVAALTIGLGITYAIHISHRFLEDVEKEPWEKALCSTVGHTGAALFGAAATTIGGFGILTFSILPPMAQFGIVTALSIAFSFLASVFVLPSFLAIWARYKFGPMGGEMCSIDEPSEPIDNEGAETPVEIATDASEED